MEKLKKHLADSREKLKLNSPSVINRLILECLADIHIALEILSGELDNKTDYLESRAKHFCEGVIEDMVGVSGEMAETKEGMIELERQVGSHNKVVRDMAREWEKVLADPKIASKVFYNKTEVATVIEPDDAGPGDF